MHLQLVQVWVQVIQQLEMGIWKKKLALKMRGIAPDFWKMQFSEKKFTKKSKTSSLLKIWYKHP